MGLFDFFKPKAKNNSALSISDKIILEEIKQNENEIRKLKIQNASWQKDFNTVINLRNKALLFEKEGKLQDAIEQYCKSISYGEESRNLNLNNYAHDIERLIILYNKTKQREKLVDLLERLVIKYSDSRYFEKWSNKLSSVNSDKNK
jgi:tetratricopeptide (TPR) repeat protein